jgi:hypothetical protein
MRGIFRYGRVRLGLLIGFVAAVVLSFLVGSAAAALAPGCTFDASSGETTCVFASTGAEQAFTVPAGVRSVHVVAQGAPGGNTGALGGRGALVSGDLSVTPNSVLYVEVGGAPTDLIDLPSGFPFCFGIHCVGGFNGGGSGGLVPISGSNPGGGGGASDVRTTTRSDPTTLASRLLVAGGGGGAGGIVYGNGLLGDTAGGDAGSAGATAGNVVYPFGPITVYGGTGGGAGSESAGGAGGTPDGQEGSLGAGGTGASGGGGGGGFYGGGSGGNSTHVFTGTAHVFAGGGGGGGGSNLVPAGGTAALTSDSPYLTIAYSRSALTDQVANLLGTVSGVGPGKSLANKLTGIQDKIAANEMTDACGGLKGFINEVKAQTGKKLTAAQAASFTTQANSIDDTLGC